LPTVLLPRVHQAEPAVLTYDVVFFLYPRTIRQAEGRAESMKIPDWRRLVLCDGVLAEPSECDRIVLWVRGSRENGFQYWQRISTAGRAMTVIEDGIGATTATALRTRQQVGAFFGTLFKLFRGPPSGPAWLLPSGETTEQCGERQTDVMLVWTEGEAICLDESSLRTRWPESCHVQLLGRNLFAVHGLVLVKAEPEPGQPVSQISSRQLAEEQLHTARRQADNGRLVTALTDLGILLTQEGACQRAVELLEEALALVGPLRDPAKQRDVLGNLGIALIGKDPRRATLVSFPAIHHPKNKFFSR
jgi:hypothetical protein